MDLFVFLFILISILPSPLVDSGWVTRFAIAKAGRAIEVIWASTVSEASKTIPRLLTLSSDTSSAPRRAVHEVQDEI